MSDDANDVTAFVSCAEPLRSAVLGALPKKESRLIPRVLATVLERMLDADWGAVRARIEGEAGRLADSPELAPPVVVQRLLVSGEDHRHGRHPGFDCVAIGRAIWRRLTQGANEGASTIEQQIVRVTTNRYERS